MANDWSDDRLGFVIEYWDDQLKAILEGQAALTGLPAAVADLQEDMTEVKSDIKVIKAVITGHSDELKDHEKRITSLEKTQAKT